jgi:ribonucleoside-diphosphate reductase alpha chain
MIFFSTEREMQTYTKDEAMKRSIEYFNGDELAAGVFVDKYAMKDENSNLLENEPSMMHRRIAKEFARIEKNKFKKPLSEDEIFLYLDHFKYIVPAGSPMFGIGNNYQIVSLSNCYFLEIPQDSYSSILKVDEQIVNICKRRGGVGICIDELRPNGVRTHNAALTSTGIISFLERYSNSIREVGQNNRRGAGICLLSVHHPQILDFANVKKDLTKVTGMNISVKLSDEFLHAVEKDQEYELRWPVNAREKGEEPKISRMIKARDVWNNIIENAWSMGEPGLLFFDNIKKNTPADAYEEYASKGTNPCAELNLSVLDSCRLMAMNAFSYVNQPFTKHAEFDFNLFKDNVKIAQRLMDDLVDMESEKIDQIISKIKKDPEADYIKQDELRMWKIIKKHNDEGRRTGLGMTAIGDTIAALGLKYASNDSIEIIEEITKTLKLAAYESSVEMAKELGHFKCYDHTAEKDNSFIKRISEEDPKLYAEMKKYGRRNIALTTIAPSGSVSLLTQTSSGIEPVFSLQHTRRRKLTEKDGKVDFIDQSGDKWQEFQVFHSKFKMWQEITGKTKEEDSPWYKSTANDIDWIKRVELQGKVQKHICHSISSTINLPKETSKEIVAKIYESAWKHGLKGITVYRDGSRSGVLVKKTDDCNREAPKRPKELECEVFYTNVSKKLDKVRYFEYIVFIGLLNNQPYELFAIEGSNGKKTTTGKIIKHSKGCYDAALLDGTIIKDITKNTTNEEDALTRMVSTLLRHNVPIHFITQQLNKIEGDMFVFSKCIARTLKKFIKDGTKSGEICSNCGDVLIFENGCYICRSCGNSKCS